MSTTPADSSDEGEQDGDEKSELNTIGSGDLDGFEGGTAVRLLSMFWCFRSDAPTSHCPLHNHSFRRPRSVPAPIRGGWCWQRWWWPSGRRHRWPQRTQRDWRRRRWERGGWHGYEPPSVNVIRHEQLQHGRRRRRWRRRWRWRYVSVGTTLALERPGPHARGGAGQQG